MTSETSFTPSTPPYLTKNVYYNSLGTTELPSSFSSIALSTPFYPFPPNSLRHFHVVFSARSRLTEPFPSTTPPPTSMQGVEALSVPALWDTLHDLHGAPKNKENLVVTWFNRAGVRPLSLEVTYFGESESFHVHSIVRQHASRLQSLRLRTDGVHLFDLANIRPFPLLRDLTLGSFNGILDTDIPIPAFSGAPLLRHLSIDRIAPSALLMPWAQLTKFVAITLNLHDCLEVLRLAPSLCEFERFNTPEEDSDDEALLCHPHLNSLFIHAEDGADHHILEFLTLPHLQEFKLGSRIGYRSHGLNTIVRQFLSQTSSTLRKFSVGISPEVPIQWLHLTTHLTTLDLIRPCNVGEVVHALNRTKAPDFLPQLQNLTYSECTSDQVDTWLLDALNSRCAADGTDSARVTIQSFRLIWPEYPPARPTTIPPPHLASLRALTSRGMRIHIGTPDHNTFY